MSSVVRDLCVKDGTPRAVSGAEGSSLLEVIRSELGVRSASRGCDDRSCGACRVLLNGAVVRACSVLWRDVVAGARLETYEDLEADPAAARATAAFEEERATRCRLCVGALGVTAVALARAGRSGDPESVQDALVDATCMCTGRASLRRALLRR